MTEAQKIIKHAATVLAFLIIFSIFAGIFKAFDFVSDMLFEHNESNLETEEVDEEQESLNIEVGFSKLIIKTGQKFKVETNNKHVETYIKNGSYVIEEKSKRVHDFRDSLVVVYIPEDKIYDKVFVSTGAGTVEINSLTSKEFYFNMGAGKTTISSLKVLNKTKIEGGAGKLTITSSELNDAKLECGVGEFNFNGVLNGTTEVDAGIGAVNISLLDEKENYTIYTETGIGSIMVDGEKVKNETVIGSGSKKINIEGGIGSIKFNFPSSIKID